MPIAMCNSVRVGIDPVDPFRKRRRCHCRCPLPASCVPAPPAHSRCRQEQASEDQRLHLNPSAPASCAFVAEVGSFTPALCADIFFSSSRSPKNAASVACGEFLASSINTSRSAESDISPREYLATLESLSARSSRNRDGCSVAPILSSSRSRASAHSLPHRYQELVSQVSELLFLIA